jgi:hypothetical protein
MKFKLVELRSYLTGVALALALCTQAIAAVPEAPLLTSIDGQPVPPPATQPPPSTNTSIPLSWDDPIFANTTSSGQLNLSAGSSRSDLSVNDQSGDAAILCKGSCNLTRIRIRAREGYRCVSGTQNLSYMWIEATGVGEDHADGVQCYSPGSRGDVTVKNTTIKLGGANNAGYWTSDNWMGTHTFENVLFWGGNFGLRVSADGGVSVKLKNVYFVRDSFRYGAYQFDVVNGKRVSIDQWENVHWVTIQNGKMVVGDAIPKPY